MLYNIYIYKYLDICIYACIYILCNVYIYIMHRPPTAWILCYLFSFLAPQMEFSRPPLHNPETNDATYGLDGDPSPMKVKEDIASFFPVTLQKGCFIRDLWKGVFSWSLFGLSISVTWKSRCPFTFISLIMFFFQCETGWWFQPTWKILVKLDYFPREGWNKKCLKPPPRKFSGIGNCGSSNLAIRYVAVPAFQRECKAPTCQVFCILIPKPRQANILPVVPHKAVAEVSRIGNV